MSTYLPIAQIVSAIVLIILILLQEQSSGLSGIFGGGEQGAYQTRRGVEKWIFISTITFAILFVALSVVDLIY